MTQPKLSAFFASKGTVASSSSSSPSSSSSAAAASSSTVIATAKRSLEEGAAAATVSNEGSADKVPFSKKLKEINDEGDDQQQKKAAEPMTLAPASSVLPELVANHPIIQPIHQRMDDGWRQVVMGEAEKPYFGRLISFLTQEASSKQVIYPPMPLVLNSLMLCPWSEVRVVIIGQDPYHGPNQAHGLAFSVLPPTTPPPSLKNMYKEAIDDVGIRKPTHGNLEHWSRQGVLLLNTVLTVRRGQAHSHKGKGWETFTDAVIRELDARKTGLVFLLWGKPAQDKCSFISKKKHRMITCAHPSPLSATKTNAPFIGSKSFSRANQALKELGQKPIDWNVL